MLFSGCDWEEKFGSMEEITKEIEPGFKFKLGWTEADNFSALIVEARSERGGKRRYRLMYWGRGGVRAELAKLLGMPVHQHQPAAKEKKVPEPLETKAESDEERKTPCDVNLSDKCTGFASIQYQVEDDLLKTKSFQFLCGPCKREMSRNPNLSVTVKE